MIWDASLLLAAVFLTAAAAKLADRKRGEALVAFGVPARLAQPAVWLLIGIELAIAVALLVDRSRLAGAIGVLTLLAVLTATGTANLLRGRTPECACFGKLTRGRIGWSTVARNGLLASIAAYVAVGGRGPGVFVGLAVAFGAAWAILGPLRSRHKPSLPELEHLLRRGRPVLLVFSQPACPACRALLPQLEEWEDRLGKELSIAVVDAGGTAGSAYGVTATPSAVLVEPGGSNGPLAQGPDEIVELVRTRFTADDEPRLPRRALIARAAGGVATLGVFPLLAAACGSSSSSRTTTTTPTKSLKVGDEYICHQTYALCTNAACVPSKDDPNVVVCDCVVEPGYSVGFKTCPQRAPHGSSLYSNFSTALATSSGGAMTCPADAPWANCLDYPCELDPNDPTKATCRCALVKRGPSFTFGGDCDSQTCGKTIWSGAHSGLGGGAVTAAMKRVGQPLVLPKPCPKA